MAHLKLNFLRRLTPFVHSKFVWIVTQKIKNQHSVLRLPGTPQETRVGLGLVLSRITAQVETRSYNCDTIEGQIVGDFHRIGSF